MVQSAISPRPEPMALDRNPTVCQTLRLWSPAASSRLRPQEMALERHFSRTIDHPGPGFGTGDDPARLAPGRRRGAIDRAQWTCRRSRSLFGRGSKPALFGADFAPFRALMKKLAKKPAENRQKSEGKWRQMALFRGSKAPFCRARSRRPWIATRQSARPYVCGVRLRRAASSPGNRLWSAIFHERAHGPTCASYDRRADGGFHPPDTGSFRPLLNLVRCWPHSRSSARGPGWPARPHGATEMNG